MRLKALALSTTAVVMGWSGSALAQTADPAAAGPANTQAGTPADTQSPTVSPSEEVADVGADIVVTGFRESLASSRNLKRNAPQVVDAVVAEDIGKLPDLAVSDTAARIPGVQVVRLGGEATGVLVRGLPDFSTTYNGREIFTAETRQVALQDFPSAGIAALEVFKASTANLVEPGLAGLVNVRSRRPFDIQGFELAGNVWGLHTVQAGKITPNGNILVSNRWDTGIGEIGVLVNASYTRLDFLDSEPSNTDFIADPTINGTPVRLPDIQRLFYRSGERSRPSGNAAIQWRPSPGLEFYVEGLYQGFRNKVNDTLAAVNLYGGQSYSNIVLREGTNLVSSGTVVNPAGRIFSFRGGTFNKTDTYQYAAGGIYDQGPLRVSVDVARTESTFTGSTESVDREFGLNGFTVNFDNETPQFSVSGFDFSDPANYRFLGLYEEQQESKGDDIQARFDAEYRFDSSFLRSFQLGARYTTRDAHREFGNRYGGGFDVPITAVPLDFQPVRAGFKGTDVQGLRTFLAPTYDGIRRNRVALRQYLINAGRTNFTLAPPVPNPDSVYDADEETIAGYAQLNYNFNDVVDGSVGIRAVKTDVSVDGNNVVQGVVTPASASQKFTDYLPNASIRFRPVPEVQLRLSYTQTRTRPTFQQLNPATTLGAPDPSNNNLRTGNAGNPNLTPINSTNYDASLEWYFSPTGFASAAVFRRDLRGFIQDASVRFTDPTFGFVQITQPVNSRAGRIDGAEVQLSTFFDFGGLPDFLRSFGVQANYTYLDAETDFLNATNTLERGRIQGVSKHSVNVAGLFERGPLSVRLTYNWRSKFLDFRQARGDEATGFFVQEGVPPGRLDLSTNLTVVKNLTVFFDATNLTGEPFQYNFTSARAGAPAAEYVRFLRFEEQTFSLGLRFRY